MVALLRNFLCIDALTGHPAIDRRSIFAPLMLIPPQVTNAARGAAELDAEYYFRGALRLDRDRDIFDRREPLRPPEPAPNRNLDPDFASIVLAAAGERARISTSQQASEVCERIYLKLVNSDDRTTFAARIGDALCDRIKPPTDVPLRDAAQSIVDTFARSNWITSGVVEFADGDNEDATPRPLQVTLREPVTAPVAANLERRGFIYHPDFTGLCLASCFRRRGYTGQFDEYLLDDTYRSDPRAFQASSTLLLFQLLEY